MTYSPSLYVDRYDNRYWLFLTTPSGAVVRLYSSYQTHAAAEAAVGILGFRLVAKPVTSTLNRANTTAR
jgi:hypothetical protein